MDTCGTGRAACGGRKRMVYQICFVVTSRNIKNINLDNITNINLDNITNINLDNITNINTITTDCHSTSIFGFILDI